MEDRKQEVPETREPACMLCRREEADPDLCGDKREKHGLCAHVFCLYFATLLPRQENERLGILGFLPRDIQRVVSRAAQKHCCVCGRSGATIMCCEGNCDRWFHLPCAKEGGCVTQYIPEYSSYCPEHRPEQDVQATPEPGTDCPICMEPVEDRKTYTTMVCPACKRTWFHRDCMQGQAMRTGLLCFHCPLCRNIQEFLPQMFILGIRIPFRQPTWEDNDAFAELGGRHSRCNARTCLYPGGREEAEEQGPWQLLLCSSCAAEGTHRRCSGLRNGAPSWECDSCAGLGTAPTDEPELSGPSVTRPVRRGPRAQRPRRRETASGTSPRRSRSRQQRQASNPPVRSRSRRDRSQRRALSAQRPRRRETASGTSPRRSRSRRQRQASNPPVQSRICRDRSQRTESSAQRPRRMERASGTSPRRSCSRRQRQAPNPPVRSRSRRDRSQGPAPSAGRPRRRDTASATSPRRSRSRRQRQAPNPHGPSRSRRDRSQGPAPSAGRPRRRDSASQTSPRRNRSRRQRQVPAGSTESSM